jgi:hypothetical protein
MINMYPRSGMKVNTIMQLLYSGYQQNLHSCNDDLTVGLRLGWMAPPALICLTNLTLLVWMARPCDPRTTPCADPARSGKMAQRKIHRVPLQMSSGYALLRSGRTREICCLLLIRKLLILATIRYRRICRHVWKAACASLFCVACLLNRDER